MVTVRVVARSGSPGLFFCIPSRAAGRGGRSLSTFCDGCGMWTRSPIEESAEMDVQQRVLTLKTWLIMAGARVAQAVPMTHQTCFARPGEGMMLPLSRILLPVAAYSAS